MGTYRSVVELEIDVRVDLLKKRMRRDDALLQGHCKTWTCSAGEIIEQLRGVLTDGFDNAGQAAASFEMSDVGLYGATTES